MNCNYNPNCQNTNLNCNYNPIDYFGNLGIWIVITIQITKIVNRIVVTIQIAKIVYWILISIQYVDDDNLFIDYKIPNNNVKNFIITMYNDPKRYYYQLLIAQKNDKQPIDKFYFVDYKKCPSMGL